MLAHVTVYTDISEERLPAVPSMENMKVGFIVCVPGNSSMWHAN